MARRSPSKRPYSAAAPRQLQAIASPGREDIIDAVGLLGPSTVPDIAAALHRSRHGLYYHVSALVKVGLLVEAGVKLVAGKPAKLYDLPGRPLLVEYDLHSARSRRAVVRLGETRLRNAARGFRRACDPSVAVVSGPRRNVWVARWQGWLTNEDLERVN